MDDSSSTGESRVGPTTDEESDLSEEARRVLHQCGTEPPHSSDLLDVDEPGTFECADCGQALFETETKFESGSGWPSFWDAVAPDAVERRQDHTGRMEVVCTGCGGHLGHVFQDGPEPTGERYCINGVALSFAPE